MMFFPESPDDKIFQEDLEFIADNFSDKEDLKNKTFFITGATGLIGSTLIKALLCMNRKYSLNIKIIAQIRNEEKAKKVFSNLLNLNYFSLFKSNLDQNLEIDEHIDFIIHSANITTSKIFVEQPVETILSTINLTKNVLELAIQKKVKSFVYLSSMEIYGFVSSYKKITEENLGYIDNLNIRSSYSEGKRLAECLVISYNSEYYVPGKIARLAQTFGAGTNISDNRLFAQLTKSCIKNEDIVLHTKGLSFGNYCYTADAVLGILKILLRGKNSEAYNIVNENTTMMIKDVAALCSAKLNNNKSKIVFNIPKSAFTFGYAPDTSLHLSSEKLKALGWNSHFDLPEMFIRLKKSFEAQISKNKLRTT